MIDASRARDGPHAAISRGSAEDLRRQVYGPGTALEHPSLLGVPSNGLNKRKLTADGLSMLQIDSFLSDRRSAGATRHDMRKPLGFILGDLRGLVPAPAIEASRGERRRRDNSEPDTGGS